MQVEVADKVGMTHSVYKAIEEGSTQHIEPEKVDSSTVFREQTSWMILTTSFIMDKLFASGHTGNPMAWERNLFQEKWESRFGAYRNGSAEGRLSV